MNKRKGTSKKNKGMKKDEDSVAEIKKKIKQEKEALLKIIQNIQKDK